MKKIALLLLLIVGLYVGFKQVNLYKEKTKNNPPSQSRVKAVIKPDEKTAIKSKSLFVPSWSLSSGDADFSGYQQIIYFGITPDYRGINKSEAGYRGIDKFDSLAGNVKKLITLRMLNDDINESVLADVDLQNKIISETLEIVEQYSFDGVVLDLEISGLYNEALTTQINNFVQLFYTKLNEDYRRFYLAIYGDNFYRKRPFDLSFLAENSDGIYIMAYDFHKSRGEPGPNFPFDSGRRYGYDFKTMISDFQKFVPKEKITVIFGMFGYDWMVDEKKRPITQAKALSLNEISKKFIAKCEFKNCITTRDELSKESEVNYIISSTTPDEQQMYRIDYHIVWYEDEESVKIKTDYLLQQGISSVSYWANGYF